MFFFLVAQSGKLLFSGIAFFYRLLNLLVFLLNAVGKLLLALFELLNLSFKQSAVILQSIYLVDKDLNMAVLLANNAFKLFFGTAKRLYILLQSQNLKTQRIMLFMQNLLCIV